MIIRENLFEAFKELQFNADNHLYFLEGKNYPSATTLIKRFYEPFDKSIAKWSARKAGVTEQEILAQWKAKADAALELGNRVHDYAEKLAVFYAGLTKEIRSPQDFKELGIYQWYQDLDRDRYILLVTELPLYHKPENPEVDGEAYYAGTADAIFYDRKLEGLLVVDWKTNNTLFKNYKNKKMLGPFKHLLDNNYNHYQIQLSLYRMALEDAGFPVVGQKIVWVDKQPNKDFRCYVEHDTEYFEIELRDHFKGQKINLEYSM